ncbi:macrophage migration inhibitory factor [Brachionus plicatilis]|uniref:L-dopachrome isomerase n=1 Tax=Brachionus plicatilis TaxID=10195 RepID=A0A3M7QUT6_BRAPC|nr:macrophage migration inhibitory factor [Brachionus plicatilis]
MPMLQISTNIAKEKITEEFNLNLSDVLANTLNKPIGYCAVHIMPDQLMSFGGTFEPCAMVTLMSIGRLGVEENKKHSKAIMCELEKLGIPPNRIYIFFQDAHPYEVGYNETTFAEILATNT